MTVSSQPSAQAPVAAERARRRLLAGDLVAGVSVALVLIPQALAYAQLAGLPPQAGLYASALPLVVAALFASSPYLQTGPTAITSLLTLGALASLATPGSSEFAALALLLALVVGVVRMAVGLLRVGAIAFLMSQPMLIGFVPASALLIIASQLPTALGAQPPDGGILHDAGWALVHPDAWAGAAVALSAAAALLVMWRRPAHPLFPGVLVAVAIGLAASHLLGYGGSTVGSVPTGLPPLSLDMPWAELPTLLVGGVVIALVGFAEPSSIARTFAALGRQRWSANREFVSQGVANLVAGVSGGFPIGGSFSRSSLNRLAGARTRLSGAITGVAVLLFLPFASSLSALPEAVLAGVVIGAVIALVRIGPLIALYRQSRVQWTIAATTFVLTLALAPRIEWAVLAGIALAIAIHLWRERALELQTSSVGDTLHLSPRGVLWFGNARLVEDRFLDLLASHPMATRLAIHLHGLGRIDLTGALAIKTLAADAARAGLTVSVDGVAPHAQPLMGRVLPDAVSTGDREDERS